MTTTNYNAWKAAGMGPTNFREYYGKIHVNCVAMVFPGEKGSGLAPVVYNPSIHQDKQPFTQITIKLQPLPEMQLSNEVSKNWQHYNSDWVKITMPSIRRLGFVDDDGYCDVEKFNGVYVKFRFIPGLTKNRDPEKPNYKTMEFLASYKDEAECRRAYLNENQNDAKQAASVPSSTEQVKASDPAVASALVFIRSIAENAMKAGNPIPEAVDSFLLQNSAACAGLKIDSPEIQALLKDFDENPPF